MTRQRVDKLEFWPSCCSLLALERIPAWHHGLQDWMLDERLSQLSSARTLRCSFEEWRYHTELSKQSRRESSPGACVYLVVALDITIIICHVCLPLLLLRGHSSSPLEDSLF